MRQVSRIFTCDKAFPVLTSTCPHVGPDYRMILLRCTVALPLMFTCRSEWRRWPRVITNSQRACIRIYSFKKHHLHATLVLIKGKTRHWICIVENIGDNSTLWNLVVENNLSVMRMATGRHSQHSRPLWPPITNNLPLTTPTASPLLGCFMRASDVQTPALGNFIWCDTNESQHAH